MSIAFPENAIHPAYLNDAKRWSRQVCNTAPDIREEYVNLRASLRARSCSHLRESLLVFEARGGALRVAGLEGPKERARQVSALTVATADCVLAECPKPTAKEVARQAKCAKCRKRLGRDWQYNDVTRAFMLLRGQSGTAKEEQKCVSLCAWMFAISGMLICIDFLISESINSRESPMLITRISKEDALRLFAVTFCSVIPRLLSLATFTQGNYTGRALFGARSFVDHTTNSIVVA